jgi:hypothetical protein
MAHASGDDAVQVRPHPQSPHRSVDVVLCRLCRMVKIGTIRRHDRRPTNPIWQLPTLEVGRARRSRRTLAKRHAPLINPHAWRVHGSLAFSFLSDLTERKSPQLSLLYVPAQHTVVACAHLA